MKIYGFCNIVAILSLSTLYAVDYTNRLPSDITLQSGEIRNANAILKEDNWGYTFGNIRGVESGYDFNITTNGTKGTLNLTAKKPNPPIISFISSFHIGNTNITNTDVNFNDFDKYTLTGAVNLNNSNTKFLLGTMGEGRLEFYSKNSKIILNNHSSFTSDAKIFDIYIMGAGLWVNGESKIELTSAETSNAGSISINGKSEAHFKEVINVGLQTYQYGSTSAIANFIVNDSVVIIDGDFANGGEIKKKNFLGVYETLKGGGNLVVIGGDLHIKGELVSKADGIVNPNLGDTGIQPSSITIKGGIIKADNGITNEAGSTIIFGAHNGEMGQINGNLTNNGGKILVDIAGADFNKQHTLVTGGSIDNIAEIVYRNGSDDFINAKINNGSLILNLDNQKIESFKSTLHGNESQLLEALNSKLGNNIYTNGGSVFLKGVIGDIDNAFSSHYSTLPFLAFDLLKQNLSFTTKKQSVSIRALGGGVMGESIGSGGFGGVGFSSDFASKENILSLRAGYLYGLVNNNFSNIKSSSATHIFQVGLSDIIMFRGVELGVGANFQSGIFGTNYNLEGLGDFSGDTDYRLHQFDFDLSLGYKFGDNKFAIKPLFGLNNHLVFQGEFSSKNGFELGSSGYNGYRLEALAALEASISLKNSGIFARLGYEYVLYNSHENTLLTLGGNALSLEFPYRHKFGAVLGVETELSSDWIVNIEGFYKSAFKQKFAESSHFGGNIAFGYRF